MHVACHELLGHGTGKLIYRTEGEPTPTFVDPFTKEEFQSCYEPGETWNNKFGRIASSYEECRADMCGFFLAVLPEVYSLFGIEHDEAPMMLHCSVLNHFRKAILGLGLYSPEAQKWGQAHTQGAFVFVSYILQNQKSDIARIELNEDKTDFRIHLNRENLFTEGLELIS